MTRELWPEEWAFTVSWWRDHRDQIETWVEEHGHKHPVEVAYNRAILADDYALAVKIYLHSEYFKLKTQPKKTYLEAQRLTAILKHIGQLASKNH